MAIRRVVTGHDRDGKSVVIIDDETEERGLTGLTLWTTDSMPRQQRRHRRHRQPPYAHDDPVRQRPPRGELPPGTRRPMHRTLSIDYGVVLEGECDMEIDDGQIVHLKTGDVLVQRGTNHAWANNSDAVCKMAWVCIEAQPIMIDGQPLPDNWIPSHE